MSDIREKIAAWQRALYLTDGDGAGAASVIKAAERNVMRRLLIATLQGGEAAYWDLVVKEIES